MARSRAGNTTGHVRTVQAERLALASHSPRQLAFSLAGRAYAVTLCL